MMFVTMENVIMNRHLALELIMIISVLADAHQDNQGNDDDIHGGVKMGIPKNGCDNAKWKLQVDWDNTTDIEYTCPLGAPLLYGNKKNTNYACVNKKTMPRPLHQCMDTEIVYEDIPPTGGPHRPLWPVFGEYQFAPPQRWVHSLEHGGVVFLYHPCAPPADVRKLKKLAKSCLWRHIITPYRQLDPQTPFALVSYGCKLLMGEFNEVIAREFVKEHALQAPESHMIKDGTYDYGLVDKADIVSDIYDSEICPHKQWPDDDLLIAEAMIEVGFDRP